ncbi:hypothetical protein CEXT_219561 [Caerostris extrusa]|uniref:Uncharacterized protein n=1 Tax=Caerostris extrusa TaxID=172846 RepID=A0AAV4MIM8_CAEEX|nr:hypothetical protein CEXT_219561 [Caerostris extrusa]
MSIVNLIDRLISPVTFPYQLRVGDIDFGKLGFFYPNWLNTCRKHAKALLLEISSKWKPILCGHLQPFAAYFHSNQPLMDFKGENYDLRSFIYSEKSPLKNSWRGISADGRLRCARIRQISIPAALSSTPEKFFLSRIPREEFPHSYSAGGSLHCARSSFEETAWPYMFQSIG